MFQQLSLRATPAWHRYCWRMGAMRRSLHLPASLPVVAAVTACAAALLVTGCSAPEARATLGQEGRIAFKYVSGWAFVARGGYPLTTALAPGTTESIQLQADLPMSVRADSSDQAVASFEVRPDTITDDGRDQPFLAVHAHAPGVVELRLTDEGGQLIDRVPVRVTAPAQVIIVVDDVDETRPLVIRGTEGQALARALDAEGNEVLASSGWTWRVADPSVASLWVLNASDEARSAQEVRDTVDFVTVFARAPGETTLTASVAGAQATTPVRVGSP